MLFKILKNNFFLFIFLHSSIKGQDLKAFFISNSVKIEKAETNNHPIIDSLLQYDCFFFGEQHELKGLADSEIEIFKLIKRRKHINIYFSESPVYSKTRYLDLMNMSKKDTSMAAFSYYSGKNKDEERILRYLYTENTSSTKKTTCVPIDIIEYDQFLKEDILFYFKNKKTRPIKSDLSLLKKIKNKSIAKRSLNIKLFLDFYRRFENNKNTYKAILDNDYDNFTTLLDGFYSYVEITNDSLFNDCFCKSPVRESFMFTQIQNTLLNTDSIKHSFISINGVQHIPLTFQSNWNKVQNWESLACKFNKAFPYKRVCSIYFMNRDVDLVGDYHFKEKKEMILKNIPNNGIYLIKLTGEESLFREIADKFQYIILY